MTSRSVYLILTETVTINQTRTIIMFDDNAQFGGDDFFEDEGSDLILPADQANMVSQGIQEARTILVNLGTNRPLDDDLDQEDDNFALLVQAYGKLQLAIKAVTAAQTAFIQASS